MGNHYPFETGGFQLVNGVVTGMVGRTWPFWEDSLLIQRPLLGSSDMNQIQPFQMEFNQPQQGILQFDLFQPRQKHSLSNPNSGFSSSLGPATVAHIATFLKDTSMVAAFWLPRWSRYAFFPLSASCFPKNEGGKTWPTRSSLNQVRFSNNYSDQFQPAIGNLEGTH